MGVCFSNNTLDKDIKGAIDDILQMELDGDQCNFVDEDHRINNITSIFEFKRNLGEGGSCEVSEVINKKDSKHYALKKIKKDNENFLNSFIQEYEVLHSLNHPNIIHLETTYMDDSHYFIITTLYTGGALFDRIKKLDYFSEKQAAIYIKTILKTIQHCHDNNIVHRDLKPENIVLDSPSSDANLVIIDFGEAKKIKDDQVSQDFVGTILYLAPELMRLRHGWELKKADVWAIGVITYMLVCGRAPFMGDNNKTIINKILLGKFSWPHDIILSKECKDFIKSILNVNTSLRYSVEKALQHPWIDNNYDKHLGDQLLKNIGDFTNINILKKLMANRFIMDMSPEQKEVMVLAFRELDKDKNGYVEESEMVDFFISSGLGSEVAREKAKQIMKIMDPRESGKITLASFIQSKSVALLHQRTATYNDNDLLEEFRKLDKNKDGKVSIDEFRHYFGEKQLLEKNEIEKMIKQVDLNNDGEIDFEEFKKALLE